MKNVKSIKNLNEKSVQLCGFVVIALMNSRDLHYLTLVPFVSLKAYPREVVEGVRHCSHLSGSGLVGKGISCIYIYGI